MDSYDAFEKWIKGMNEDVYEDWLEDTATPLQEEKALNIREPLSEQEEEDIEQEQISYEPSTVEHIRVPEEIYDNRQLPRITKTVNIEINPETKQVEQVKEMPRVTPTPTNILREVQQSRPQQRNRIITALSNFLARFRRRRQ